jgi:SAM-dependent methyltransferase
VHDSVFTWVAEQVTTLELADRSVLEVGSYDVNGSVRPLFSGPYVGIDLRPGPGVDIVAAAARLPFRCDSFDVVVCTEVLEHDPSPWLSLPEMARVLAPDGVMLVTARGIGYPLHEHPGDYYRFTTAALTHLLADVAGLGIAEVSEDPDLARPGVFGAGRKPA